MKSYVDHVGVGKLLHIRVPTPLDKQNVIRMNRDTLYSIGVIDVTKPVSIVKPDSDRFQSLLLINEDHSMLPAIHEDGTYTLGQELVGTRYLAVIFRTFANPDDPADVAEANALQDQIQIIQEDSGSFEIPDWDQEGLKRVRDAINVLALTRTDTKPYFGQKALLNPLYHLLGTAAGWGGNPPAGAMYAIDAVDGNDGKTPYTVTVKDVPVHGFWSITIYNKDGFMEPNDLGVNSYNGVTSTANTDGSTTLNFGGCDDGRVNCIPIMDGWNYAVRMYQPMEEIISGEWTFPDFTPAE
ncbi:MAG: DUF1214 domain-containing protein [Proteobacteria bacterium]|nr:DUF1214 domain-containing protein [Pseudomonadota bacterium]